MNDRKFKIIIKIERDAQNYFFAKVLYGYSDEESPKTIYDIKDEDFINSLLKLTKEINIKESYWLFGMIAYCPTNGYRYEVVRRDDLILTGTRPSNEFSSINYLIHSINRHNATEVTVQYEDKLMNEREFYAFQRNLSI